MDVESTDRMREERESARHELKMFARAVEATHDIVTFHDDEGRIFFGNAAAHEFFGVALEDPLPVLAPTDYIDEPPEFFQQLEAALEVTHEWSGELVGIGAGGRRVPMSVGVVAHFDESGQVEYYSSLARDLTEYKAADAARRRTEVVLRAIVQSSPLAIYALDARGTVHVWNRAAEEVFGWSANEVVGSTPPFVDDSTRDESDGLLAQVFSGTTLRGERLRYVRRDGRPVDADIAIAPLRNADGKVVTAVAVVADVTEQTRSEQALRDSEARLRQSEARYRAVVDDQVELVCRYTADTTITFVNRAFADFYGRPSDELVGSLLIDLRAPVERAAELARLDEFGPGAEVATYDEWELGADGVRHWYRWTDRAFLDANGVVVEFQSVGHDVTEEHRALMLTANQTDILEQIARGVPLEETLRAIAGTVEAHFPRLACAVFQLDLEAGALRLDAAGSVARRFATALDGTVVRDNATPCSEAVLRREAVYVEDATVDPRCAQLHQLAREHALRGAWSTPIIASDSITVLGTISVFAREPGHPDDEHRRIFSLVAHLASIAIERKEFENRLALEFMHDPLTHLPNRLLFLDRLSQAVARGQRTHADVAVLFLDLDRFKNVNDSLGHDAGDELLVAVARRLEGVLRPGDTVARFGGDEFTILCEDLPHEAARARAVEIAQRLLTSVDRPFAVRATETFIGISIGIALTATGDETPDELLREADAAMYHAKETGRGRAEVFDDTMRARALARHATENALSQAIERGELRVFFQPIVSLHTARCVGAESLVRWQHPERGLVLPADFVPLAEDSGLIVPLGAWVLEQAADQAAQWQLAGDQAFVVSVNLSARQMAEPDLATRVKAVLENTGARPESLCFEITETALMEDADAMRHVIETVRALGVHFSIDDFGTGYSSLGYLKRFSVDCVKIDRTFVEGISDDEDDRAIVSAVIGLAHALGLRVVAEGVEREAQLAQLVALGCDEAQGYFFAPPQPGDDLSRLVSRTRQWRPPGAPLMGRS